MRVVIARALDNGSRRRRQPEGGGEREQGVRRWKVPRSGEDRKKKNGEKDEARRTISVRSDESNARLAWQENDRKLQPSPATAKANESVWHPKGSARPFASRKGGDCW